MLAELPFSVNRNGVRENSASEIADSEIRMDDGALHDDFSEQNRSWDDSGTIISDT